MTNSKTENKEILTLVVTNFLKCQTELDPKAAFQNSIKEEFNVNEMKKIDVELSKAYDRIEKICKNQPLSIVNLFGTSQLVRDFKRISEQLEVVGENSDLSAMAPEICSKLATLQVENPSLKEGDLERWINNIKRDPEKANLKFYESTRFPKEAIETMVDVPQRIGSSKKS